MGINHSRRLEIIKKSYLWQHLTWLCMFMNDAYFTRTSHRHVATSKTKFYGWLVLFVQELRKYEQTKEPDQNLNNVEKVLFVVDFSFHFSFLSAPTIIPVFNAVVEHYDGWCLFDCCCWLLLSVSRKKKTEMIKY